MRAVIWLRVSSGKQDEKLQLPDIQDHIAKHGYDTVATVTVHGESAFHGEQDPDWLRACAIDADVIVVWKLDRLDRRNLLVTVPMVNHALSVGKQVEFVTQTFIKLDTMEGRIAFALFAEMAHEESKIKSDRAFAKLAAIRAAGAADGRPPFGYALVTEPTGRKVFVPAEPEAEQVRQAFRRYQAGDSVAAIARDMGREAKWLARNVLRSPAMYGARSGVTVPLVDYSLWEEVQTALEDRTPKRRPDRTRPWILVKVVQCSCGGMMYRQGYISPGTSGRYYCRNEKCGALVSCDRVTTRAAAIMAADTRPYTVREFVPGVDVTAERARLKLAIAREDNDDKLAELVAERAALLTAKSKPSRFEDRETGVSMGKAFAAMTREEQQAEALRWVWTWDGEDVGGYRLGMQTAIGREIERLAASE